LRRWRWRRRCTIAAAEVLLAAGLTDDQVREALPRVLVIAAKGLDPAEAARLYERALRGDEKAWRELRLDQ